ncbi:hypothetical protein NQ318_004873 [Aromia moschata]|uniref:Uncharacterized protein n=1 Tax=Aromia moschata TaxID=1265417 RepID=A0AAV8Z2V1_9CUCU|nr:hypothetical protein NQ318_004873 [Aromia moschata]
MKTWTGDQQETTLSSCHMCNIHDVSSFKRTLNIDDCHKLLLSNEAIETKLALEKAKDYHYKEILDFLRKILVDIRKIIFHEEKNQRQISIFSNSQEEVVTKREKRRVASEISIGSLEAWEHYLEKKAQEEKAVSVEKSEISKKEEAQKQEEEKELDSILEGDVQEEGDNNQGVLNSSNRKSNTLESEVEPNKECDRNSTTESEVYTFVGDKDTGTVSNRSYSGDENMNEKESRNWKDNNKYSITNIVDAINDEIHLEESSNKPKIVDVVYKKKEN